ncbi:hypothetical protein ACFYYH_23040 [Streptomyces sp. NPDC002018]|uniref:hypothetical protein n=1 Tax=Streptomyces sp. NPDC002018 TaxID=3364629 RepID=UPI0036CF5ADF
MERNVEREAGRSVEREAGRSVKRDAGRSVERNLKRDAGRDAGRNVVERRGPHRFVLHRAPSATSDAESVLLQRPATLVNHGRGARR